MTKRNRLRSTRPKAVFGADGAVMAAATLAGAAINAVATANAAKQQSQAMTQSAQTQAAALKKQNENANKNQEQMIEFTREQNDLNRDLQKDIQMNLQLLTGQQNTNELREAAKIQVKRGGSMRRKLRNAPTTFLRGRNGNLPFTVTDGGNVIPIGTTPEGYDLYEIIGNDHEHYHKAQGGKSKTGVGIKFANSAVIEGEGNQNSNQGELMLVTPNDAKFISKHTLRGFNPAQAVMAGGDPMLVFNQQEAIKDIYGISDDGKSDTSTPVRRIRPYGGITTLNVSPDLSLDFLAPVATGIVAGTRQDNIAKYGRSLKKCGGRRKAPNGSNLWNTWKGIYNDYFNTKPVTLNGQQTYVITPTQTNLSSPSYSTPTTSPSNNNWYGRLNNTQKGNLWGAGFQAIGNLGGALINNIGNNIASRYLTRGYNDAADTLVNAYNNLKTIDMSAIDRNNYRAAHAMAALQAPIVQTGAERSAAERSLQRNLARINRGTLSSATAQNRNARAEIDYNDRIAQIESNAEKLRQGIIQGNMERLTQTSATNAQLDTQANQAYGQAYLNLLQYNNDIENERITGAAQARADALTQNASTIAGTKQANAASWAGALTSGLGGIGNTLATNGKMAHELEMSRYGWTAENNLNYTIRTADLNEAKTLYKRYKGAGGQYDIWATQLEDAFGIDKLKS